MLAYQPKHLVSADHTSEFPAPAKFSSPRAVTQPSSVPNILTKKSKTITPGKTKPTMEILKKTVKVFVDRSEPFEIEIPPKGVTCKWLLEKVWEFLLECF